MGFFKNLKKRLFTLDGIPEKEDKAKGAKIASVERVVNDDKVKIKVEKLEKKEEKKRQKAKQKEKRINKYIAGLDKSGSNFSLTLKELQTRHNKIDEAYFDDLEEALIMSDISINFVMDIIEEVKKEVKKENIEDLSLINEIIVDKMFVMYANQSSVDTTLNVDNEGLNVVLVVGVNGSGKTTSIAKLCNKFIKDGKKVLLAAGDTFRAGAVEQLTI
jgi:fused signal recognition particle receptor